MIVKVKNDEYSWSYFEGDNIVTHKFQEKDYNLWKVPDNILVFVKSGGARKGEEMTFLRVTVQKENKVISQFLTNKPSYLMNDLGKTIDKLI